MVPHPSPALLAVPISAVELAALVRARSGSRRLVAPSGHLDEVASALAGIATAPSARVEAAAASVATAGVVRGDFLELRGRVPKPDRVDAVGEAGRPHVRVVPRPSLELAPLAKERPRAGP